MTAEALQLPELGEVIGEGRFELLQQLGDGGMSTVFLAVDRFLGRDVALKLLTPRYVGRPEREQRLINEAEYLRRVQGHPHIVELIDSGRLRDRDGWPWLTTEILHGEVLGRQFIHGKIELPRVVSIARQVALALEACHVAGVVHRDITPSNVFILDDHRTAKLFDFSHAADLHGPKLAAGAPERLTGVFDTPGTIGFMGPEQVHNAPPDVSMDAFGFGALLFKLVTGRNPYRQFTDRDEFIKAQREGTLEPPRLHAWAYDAPEALAELLHDCTQHDGAKRPSMAEVIARLDALELPSVQDDDATSFFRRPAVAGVRTASVDPSAVRDEPEVTAPVDLPTMIRPRSRRSAPLEGDWVAANQQLARPVAAAGAIGSAGAAKSLHQPAEEPKAIQLPFARPLLASPRPVEPEAELAFARPPELRPPSPIELPSPVVSAAVEAPPTVEEASTDLPSAPPITRRCLLPVGVALLGGLLVLAWFVWEARTRQPFEHERPTPAKDTEDIVVPPHEHEITPPHANDSGPALEPVPEIASPEDLGSPPEPEPKPEPKPKQHHPKHKPTPTEHVKADCEGVEHKGRAAADKEDWRQVASSTARKECWASSQERVSLRVRAMYELGNWKECAALADKADAGVQKYVQQCQSLTNQGSP